MIRLRAIRAALWFGARPYWMYEDSPHYAPMSYGRHLRMNLAYAWCWLTFRETAGDRLFEANVNGNHTKGERGKMDITEILTKRPTEAVTGLALAGAVYGFLTQDGVPQVVAAIIAVAIAFGPAAVSGIVDAVRGKR